LARHQDDLTPAGGSLWRGSAPNQRFQLILLFLANGQRLSTSQHATIESRIGRILNN
jgi:hypothetical protein